MSKDFDERLEDELCKHAERARQQVKARRLNGDANREREERRKAFLNDFAKKGHAVIEPVFRRVEEATERFATERLADDAEAAQRAEFKVWVNWPGDADDNEDRVELMISRDDKTSTLEFRADPVRMRVVVSCPLLERQAGHALPGLRLEEITEEVIEPLAGDFLAAMLPLI
jgi:hypothetical protein